MIALGGCLFLVVRLLKPKASGSCHSNPCECDELRDDLPSQTTCYSTSEETASTIP